MTHIDQTQPKHSSTTLPTTGQYEPNAKGMVTRMNQTQPEHSSTTLSTPG